MPRKLVFGALLLLLFTSFNLSTSRAQDDEKEKPTLNELMEEATDLFRDGKFDEALVPVKKARKLYPEELVPQFAMIQILERAGVDKAEDDRKAANTYFYQAAEVAEGLMKNPKTPPQAMRLITGAIYNKAASLAIDGKKEASLKELLRAFENGFDNVAMAKADEDFKSLAESKEFAEVLAKGKAFAEKRRAEAIAKQIKKVKAEMATFKSFEFDFDLKNTKGGNTKFADFKGKFLIVDVWGTWCPPCIAEIPHFIKLKEKYGSKGLEIIGIAYERTEDEEEAVEAVNEFMKEKKVNYDSVIGDKETNEMIGVPGYPTTLFIDGEGKVRYKAVGYKDYEVLEAIVQEIMKK